MEKKNVVISGGSRGIGRALAELFSKNGHGVFTFGRTKDLGFEPGYEYTSLDICSYKDLKQWADAVLEKIEAPDLIIHNAALINEVDLLEDLNPEEYKKLIDVNVTGVLNLSSVFLPSMKKRKKGGVIGLSSYWGREGAKNFTPYVASKYAVEGICQSLSLELDNPMFSVALNPGIIDTDMLFQCFGEHAHEYPSATEWAEKAGPFILSLNRRHNGESLTVPG